MQLKRIGQVSDASGPDEDTSKSIPIGQAVNGFIQSKFRWEWPPCF